MTKRQVSSILCLLAAALLLGGCAAPAGTETAAPTPEPTRAEETAAPVALPDLAGLPPFREVTWGMTPEALKATGLLSGKTLTEATISETGMSISCGEALEPEGLEPCEGVLFTFSLELDGQGGYGENYRLTAITLTRPGREAALAALFRAYGEIAPNTASTNTYVWTSGGTLGEVLTAERLSALQKDMKDDGTLGLADWSLQQVTYQIFSESREDLDKLVFSGNGAYLAETYK